MTPQGIIEALDEADALLAEYLAMCAAGYAAEDERVAEAAGDVAFALGCLKAEAGE